MSSEEPQPWCLIESDPWVFTDLLKKLGVKGVQMMEVCSLDDIDQLKSVYALLFLFKCKKSSLDPAFEHGGSFIEDNKIHDIYFAKQMIVNACATQALLNMLLNLKDTPNLELGETLSNFREFSTGLDPKDKGLALDFSEPIRNAHNSFARPNMFTMEGESKKKDKDSFHYVGFVPICGRLVELDGLKNFPIDHGSVAANWVETASTIIKSRMPESETGDFNLLAMTYDRRQAYASELEALRKHVSQSVAEPTELQRIAELEQLLAEEEKNQLRYEIDSIRHAHNWTPFIVETMKILAKYGQLTRVMEDQLKNAAASGAEKSSSVSSAKE